MLDDLHMLTPTTYRRRLEDQVDRSIFPLSLAQRRLWLLAQLEPESSANNLSIVLAFSNAPDRLALTRALRKIVRRHDVLRSLVTLADGEPVRLCDDAFTLELPVRSLAAGVSLDEAIATERHRVFDLMDRPPIRATLIETPDAQSILVLTVHRIAADKRSLAILERELDVAYDDALAARRSSLPPLWSRYEAFVAAQDAAAESEVAVAGSAYWRATLAGAPERLDLPIAAPTAGLADVAREVSHTLEPALVSALRALATAHETDLFTVLAAGFAVLLSRYTGEPDIVLGAPIGDRSRIGFEWVVGLFAETFPLRTRIAADASFAAFLAGVRATAAAARPHRHADFDRLTEELRPSHGAKRKQLASVGFAVIEPDARRNLHFTRLRTHEATTLFDLALEAIVVDDDIICSVAYRANLFEAGDVQRLVRAYATLLRAVCADPEILVSRVPLVDESDALRQLTAWNDTVRPYDRRRTHEAFEGHAAAAPESSR